MESEDFYSFMLYAQKVVQQYIDLHRIDANNAVDFLLSFKFQTSGTSQTSSPFSNFLDVAEFKYDRAPGEILPSLPPQSRVDFHSVVKVTYERNCEEYALLFTCGFFFGLGSILQSVD